MVEKEPENVLDNSTETSLEKNANVVLEKAEEAEKADKIGVDQAYYLAEETKGLELTKELSDRILWKIDIYIQPVIWVLYALQYMDKVTNSYAGVMGITKDLNLVGNQFAWLGTAFYLGYLVAEFPFAQLLQRLPHVKVLSLAIVIWGVILACHAAAHNAGGIIAARTLLGIFESAVTPGFIILTSQWYRKEEQFARIAYWFSCNGAGNLVGGAIAYGLAKHAHSYSIEAWRILFIITGLITIVAGVLVYFYIPSNPAEAWFLTPQERLHVVERIRTNQQGFGSRTFKWYQFVEAFKDPRTYIYILWGLTAQIPNGGLGSFGSILLNKTLGYTPLESLLMGLPQGGVQIASGIIGGYIATRTQKRVAVGTVCCSLTLIGMCLLAFAKTTHAKLAGYYMAPFYAIGMVTILSLISSDTAGHTKKLTVSAAFLVSYCVGNLIGPQTFRAGDAPSYSPARITMASMVAVATVDLSLLFFINLRENRIRNKKESENPGWYIAPENAEFRDLTDFENKNFRYSL